LENALAGDEIDMEKIEGMNRGSSGKKSTTKKTL